MVKKPSAFAISVPQSASVLSPEMFQQAYTKWLQWGKYANWSSATCADRRWWCDRVYRYLTEQGLEFCSSDLLSFFLALREGRPEAGCTRGPLSDPSLKHAHSLLRAFTAWAVSEGHLGEDVMKRIPAPRLPEQPPKHFTDEEIDRLLEAARNTRNAKRDYALLSLLLDSGLRAAEAAALKIEDIDFDNGHVHVKKGKGGKGRISCFGKSTGQALWKYISVDERRPSEMLFVTEAGSPMSAESIGLVFRRLGAVTGIKGCGPHRMRHSCGVQLLRSNVSTLHTMRQLGHSCPSLTARYVKLVEGDLQAIMETSSPADKFALRAKGRRVR